MSTDGRLCIVVAGPYRTGAPSESERAANLTAMNQVALQLVRMGHVPVIGVNMALPVIAANGGHDYQTIMDSIALGLIDRCDAILRIGGPSAGSDAEVERCRAQGKPVFYALEEIPARVSGQG
jgi:hypothetical protein